MRVGRMLSLSVLLVIAVGMLSLPATAAPAWGPQRTVDRWSWSGGASLDRLANGDLIALEVSDFAQGSFAADHGPYMGVFAGPVPTAEPRGRRPCA